MGKKRRGRVKRPGAYAVRLYPGITFQVLPLYREFPRKAIFEIFKTHTIMPAKPSLIIKQSLRMAATCKTRSTAMLATPRIRRLRRFRLEFRVLGFPSASSPSSSFLLFPPSAVLRASLPTLEIARPNYNRWSRTGYLPISSGSVLAASKPAKTNSTWYRRKLRARAIASERIHVTRPTVAFAYRRRISRGIACGRVANRAARR